MTDDVERLLQNVLTPAERAVCSETKTGYSGARVFEIGTAPARSFLKIDQQASPNSLRIEHAVLQHLAAYLPVPRVLSFYADAGLEALHMSALPGLDASTAELLAQPQRLVPALARALRSFHELPIEPHRVFDQTLDAKIAAALLRLERGQVDLDDLDESRQGISAIELAAQLHAQRPAVEDLVPTHGDYCLPNVLFDPATFALAGFVDLGRFGVADRYQDLALAERSLRHNMAGDFSTLFFDAYGIQPDPARIAFYQLLDEFF